jgi:hypothetical protein
MAQRKLGKRERAKLRAMAEAHFKAPQGQAFAGPGEVAFYAATLETVRPSRWKIETQVKRVKIIHPRDNGLTGAEPGLVLQGTRTGDAVMVPFAGPKLGAKSPRFHDAMCNWENPGIEGRKAKGKVIPKRKPKPFEVRTPKRELRAIADGAKVDWLNKGR